MKKRSSAELTNLESIEKTVRSQMLEHVSPQIALFLPLQTTGTKTGKTRKVKSCVGVLKLKAKLAERLGLKSHSKFCPLLEKCCLRSLCQRVILEGRCGDRGGGSADRVLCPPTRLALTGMIVGHSTHQRIVNRQELPLPSAKQGISEISVDGGKVRLRGEPKAGAYWRDYKAVRLLVYTMVLFLMTINH